MKIKVDHTFKSNRKIDEGREYIEVNIQYGHVCNIPVNDGCVELDDIAKETTFRNYLVGIKHKEDVRYELVLNNEGQALWEDEIKRINRWTSRWGAH